MIAKRSRGRPRGSRVDPVVRMMRQTGNPDFMAANMARDIIAYYQPRQEKEKRLRAELDACKARGGNIWPIINLRGCSISLTTPLWGLHREKKRVPHKQADPVAIELLGDGLAKPVVTIETHAAGRRIVCEQVPPRHDAGSRIRIRSWTCCAGAGHDRNKFDKTGGDMRQRRHHVDRSEMQFNRAPMMQTGNPDETITSRAPAGPVQSTKPPEALLTRKELAGYIGNMVNLSRWPLGGRDTCELCKSIDVRWHREGRLLAGRQFSWSWTSGGETSGTIKVRSEVDAVVLMYQMRSFLAAGWKSIEQRVPIAWTLSSRRPTPLVYLSVRSNTQYCGRRVAVLYLAGESFACTGQPHPGRGAGNAGREDTENQETTEFRQGTTTMGADAAEVTGTRGAMVWILLLCMAWKTKCSTFPLSNVMPARYGVSREIKRRTLEKLEVSGLIKIERRRKQSPIVTLL